jgi:L-alanine-DL-glutamate epimerase-like enolase superfamily enzyme
MNPTSISSLEQNLRYMPLKAPFVTARGRSDQARSVVVTLRTEDGLVGLGGVSPAGYVTGESFDDVQASLAAMAKTFHGADIADPAGFFARLRTEFPVAHAAIAGVEMAVVDIAAQRAKQPLWRYWGAAQPEVVTDLTVPIATLDQSRAVAAAAAADGIAHLKIKIDGTDASESLARIHAVHDAAPDAQLLVDANQSFTPDGALAFLDDCYKHDFPIRLFEQPTLATDIEGLVKVAASSEYPVGADEAVVTPKNCRDIMEAGGVQVVNIKLMKSGISGALEIIEMCRAANVTLMLGCMLESHIGIGAAVHLACGTGAFSYLDLDAPLLLSSDIARGAFTLQRDVLTPGESIGLGAVLDPVTHA